MSNSDCAGAPESALALFFAAGFVRFVRGFVTRGFVARVRGVFFGAGASVLAEADAGVSSGGGGVSSMEKGSIVVADGPVRDGIADPNTGY